MVCLLLRGLTGALHDNRNICPMVETANLKTRLHKLWRTASRLTRWLLVLVVILIAVRLALPHMLKTYVNHQLDKAPDYDGRIGHVDVQLWRGAYRINKVEIFKTKGEVAEPLFSAPVVDLSIEWKELFHGSVVGKVRMRNAKLNFVAGPTEEQTQTGKGVRWDKLLESLFPFRLNGMDIESSQIHFQNEHSSPPVDIYLNDMFATATNLTNSRDVKSELPAGVIARGTTVGGGGLDLQLQLNPMAEMPTYEVTCQLTNVELVALNDFLKAYGKFDVEHGIFALYASVAAKDGNYEGYAKVFFDDLDVFEWEKERKKNAVEVFWQAIVGTLTTILKNQPKDQLATRIPISGTYEGTNVDVLSSIGTLLRHAFIRALIPRLDEEVKVQEVAKQAEVKEKRLQQQETNALPQPDEKGGEQLKQP